VLVVPGSSFNLRVQDAPVSRRAGCRERPQGQHHFRVTLLPEAEQVRDGVPPDRRRAGPVTPRARRPRPPWPDVALKYLALGDSYTIGEGVADGERWHELWAAALAKIGNEVAPPRYPREKPAGPPTSWPPRWTPPGRWGSGTWCRC
jgi:hypothetical protein